MKFRLILILILLFAFFFVAISYYSEIQSNKPGVKSVEKMDTVKKERKLLYGLNPDDFEIEIDTIRNGEFLSNALMKHGVDYALIDRLARQSRPVFDVRSIRPDRKYSIFKTRDSLRTPRFFVYELNPADYVMFELGDSVICSFGRNPVDTVIRETSGVISSSLWNAMMASDDDPELAIALSEVYAWTIDFMGIQTGDSYKCIYEDLYVDGQRIGIGKIESAMFRHADKDYYAFWFVQDSIPEYFDQDGKNMKRQFLKAPLKFSRISSGFSHSRLHPILKRRRPHHGVDYAAPSGTPVHTIGNGTVIYAGYSGGAGRMVKIRHNHMYTTAYLHLSRFGKGISPGAKVSQGQTIGYVGSSGLSTGPHLDFRFYKFGTALNPLKIDAPPLKPVRQENMGEFLKYAGKMQKRLDSMTIQPPEIVSSEKDSEMQ
ncbi:MAG: peptidoglycan DD-metalloendopeptidase family protein [Candidatus Kapaibacterium sp.]